MTAAGHTFPNFNLMMGQKSAHYTDLASSSKLGCALIHSTSTFNWVTATQAYVTMSDFLGNSGSGGGGALTEESGTGYARATLSSVTCTLSGLVVKLTCAAISWTTSTISSSYLVVYDFTSGGLASTNDANNYLVCYQDFGGAQADTAGTFTFTPDTSGLATWTAS